LQVSTLRRVARLFRTGETLVIGITRTREPKHILRVGSQFNFGICVGREIMTQKKKRDKVIAEITMAHLHQFAQELGRPMSLDEAITFLNQNGRAYAMWKHMMEAGEQYIKSALEHQQSRVVPLSRNSSHRSRLAV
jgi:hypothetical protein